MKRNESESFKEIERKRSKSEAQETGIEIGLRIINGIIVYRKMVNKSVTTHSSVFPAKLVFGGRQDHHHFWMCQTIMLSLLSVNLLHSFADGKICTRKVTVVWEEECGERKNVERGRMWREEECGGRKNVEGGRRTRLGKENRMFTLEWHTFEGKEGRMV